MNWNGNNKKVIYSRYILSWFIIIGTWITWRNISSDLYQQIATVKRGSVTETFQIVPQKSKVCFRLPAPLMIHRKDHPKSQDGERNIRIIRNPNFYINSLDVVIEIWPIVCMLCHFWIKKYEYKVFVKVVVWPVDPIN